MSDQSEKVPAYSWYALAVLTAVYVLNFLDRTLIYILFTPIKNDLHFTDLQLALLGTTSFVIFYTLLGVPFGRLADRTKRKMIIGIGLAVWSLFSGLTGLASSFWTIFFCRLMVGAGAASLGPAALSPLSDYVPPRMRATVQSGYSSGTSRGCAVGGRPYTACAAALSVPLWLVVLFAGSLTVVVIVNIVLYVLALMWVGPAPADVHDLAGPRLRGLAIGIFFSIVNIVAYGLGGPLIGRISDILGVAKNPDQMRLSLLGCPIACALGAMMLWMGSRARGNALSSTLSS